MVVEALQHEIQTLERFKELSIVRDNHQQLLADKKVLLYAATLIDQHDLRVVRLCLDIFENFLGNEDCHMTLMTTFGVYESLEALAIRMRGKNENIFKRATEITDILRNSAPPAFRTRSKTREGSAKNQTVYLLHIPDLSLESMPKFEATLVGMKGVISFLVDLKVKRCTLRICPRLTIKEVIEKVSSKCSLRCLIVTKRPEDRVEILYDVSAQSPNRSYLEYPEDEFLHKSGAVATHHLANEEGKFNLLHKVKHFWKESFYW